MSRQLPERPSLEHLKKQAKSLLSELRRERPDAQLADAQRAVATTYGFRGWAELKAHVEALPEIPIAAAHANPFAGTWIANLEKSSVLAEPSFRRATLQFEVGRDAVTIADVIVDLAGREERNTNVVPVDGVPHSSARGYVVTGRRLDAHRLEVQIAKDGLDVSRVTYAVSPDGTTLTVSATSAAHGGYPAVERVSVFDRLASA